MTSTSESSGILADILANPANDGLRLVYADWCEDNGQEERARFIRWQVLPGERTATIKVEWPPNLVGYIALGAYPPDVPKSLVVSILDILNQDVAIGPPNSGASTWIFTRGFVSKVVCKHDFWLQYGSKIVGKQPVERVELSDKRPEHFAQAKCWSWRSEMDDLDNRRHCVLRDDLWNRFGFDAKSQWKDFSSLTFATDALSAACLLHAKR